MTYRRSSVLLHLSLAAAALSVGFAGTACTSTGATSADSGIRVVMSPSCVASPVVGTACMPSVLACSTDACRSMFCTATGVWEENVGCGGPVDATTQPVDGGRGASDSADSGRDASPPHADAEAGHSDDSGRDANHSADSGRDASPPHADAEAGHSADSGHG